MSAEKCACPDCACSATGADAVVKNGKPYCSAACANGHPDGAGCGHTGCACKG